jgi:hypothetical protein
MKRRRGYVASAAAQAAALATILGGLIPPAMTVRCRVGNRLRQRPVVHLVGPSIESDHRTIGDSNRRAI